VAASANCTLTSFISIVVGDTPPARLRRPITELDDDDDDDEEDDEDDEDDDEEEEEEEEDEEEEEEAESVSGSGAHVAHSMSGKSVKCHGAHVVQECDHVSLAARVVAAQLGVPLTSRGGFIHDLSHTFTVHTSFMLVDNLIV